MSHSSLTDIPFNLFCLVEGESMQRAFSVKVSSADTVHDLKDAIKAEKSPEFDDIDANKLTLWLVEIPITNANRHDKVLFDNITTKEELLPDDELSDTFDRKPPKKTVHIMVQIPVESRQGSDQRVAELRQRIQQLQEVIDNSDATCTDSLTQHTTAFDIIVKPDREVSFSWTKDINTITLDKFRKRIFTEYPQFDDDDYLEIYFYTNAQCPIQLTDDKYGITDAARPSIGNFIPFDGIQSDPLQTPLHLTNLQELIQEVRTRRLGLNMNDSTEATQSIFVASFLLKVTTIFHEELYLAAEKYLSGRLGIGPVDYSVHSRQTNDYVLGVTEVKKENFNQGVAQNVVQLESALTQRKRKRTRDDDDGGENETCPVKTYGIVTESKEWIFIECTMDEDESVSYRLSRLPGIIDYTVEGWEFRATDIFRKLVWLITRMKNEIPARNKYDKKASFAIYQQ
ncbi:hypothetical protein EC973_003027 [Apophysomyces ossiformis]|uniref:Crinkler effector protein N-terminal domain-containing protein n=1 Tax=Apophysomyces ossiformis TaxID=679940 RepID=A0A8H7EV10_9FUNG|nr:hypothetical protein EC973_003027 [Apophysomyces ossiformis]